MLLYIKDNSFILFFLFNYFLFNIFLFLNKYISIRDIIFFSDLNKTFLSKINNVFFFFFFLSLSGLPPFSFFLFKLYIYIILYKYNSLLCYLFYLLLFLSIYFYSIIYNNFSLFISYNTNSLFLHKVLYIKNTYIYIKYSTLFFFFNFFFSFFFEKFMYIL